MWPDAGVRDCKLFIEAFLIHEWIRCVDRHFFQGNKFTGLDCRPLAGKQNKTLSTRLKIDLILGYFFDGKAFSLLLFMEYFPVYNTVSALFALSNSRQVNFFQICHSAIAVNSSSTSVSHTKKWVLSELFRQGLAH